MDTRLLEIQPQELNFIFELKKCISCSIQVTNKTLDHVAFKVKVTAPQNYYVLPNQGIVKPKSTLEITVKKKAQDKAPPNMICKDKFLIQSTMVPAETTDEDITSSLFAKDGGKYIEEKKLATILVNPSSSRSDEALKEGKALGVSDPNKDKHIEELKLKLNQLELKLHEAEVTISKLKKEKRTSIQATKFVQKTCVISCSIL